MANDPFRDNLGPRAVFARKATVRARLVVVLDGRLPKRGLELIPQETRGVRVGEVHELIGSTQPGIGANSIVDPIAYLGFMEILSAGVICAGDEMRVDGKLVGHLAGYDHTHMPNHMNIVISIDADRSGVEHGFELDQEVTFTAPAGR
ncbi:DUF6917 domain-containing protein [Ramlibacter alkalitolerans]|uniref:DUF6917 domain-containing protein n=1 Tax=Ramlibacter alkalitolerans TaxID=2039631 RepID=A0ABS1JIH6_9BURK|nr:hypothetical protein [Ramlibacter alkalitolerans]MBL0424025.1 hypothetical protein [Ramlibacter alkalitolerans]